MVDRLADLHIEITDEPNDISSNQGNQEIAEHMKKYGPIKEELAAIVRNVKEIEKLKDKDRTVAKERDRQEIMEKLEKLMSETTKKGRTIKAMLDQIKSSNVEYKKKNGNSAKAQARENLYTSNIRRFHSVMNDYNTASYDFKQGLQERTRRQLKIVDSKITDEEVEKIVASGNAQNVISDALIDTENLQDTIRDIEERHHDIIKLERQVLEVYELFKDLAVLVDIQQEHLDVIENRVTNAKAYMEHAETELVQAEKYQTKARRKKCCLIITFLVIIVIALSSILGTQLSGGDA